MDRLKKVARLWPYLPTFRAVAELEHVTRASAVLGLTPSAVSRTVGLVEKEVGQALFVRTGRRIRLNQAGRDLLACVRSSMRLVDEGMLHAEHAAFVGAVRVAGAEPFASCLAAGTFARLRERHAGLIPNLSRCAEPEMAKQVLTGLLDVAFMRYSPRQPGLVVTRIASFETAAFAPKGHPILARAGASVAAVAAEPSVDVATARDVASPWPPELARRVALVVADYDMALASCVGAGLVAVLPVAMASHRERAGELSRLARPGTQPVTLYAVIRESVTATPGRAEVLVDAAKREARKMEGV